MVAFQKVPMYNSDVSSLTQIGSTHGLVPVAGGALCMASVARSIRVTSSRNTAAYNQVVDGRAHNAAGTRSTRVAAPKNTTFIDAFGIPANARTGKVSFGQTRPDQFSR